ncbi:MAG TPA: M13 family metallopeptidase [Dokdonella sp.]|uniref:M13 family metallopeptidase n=1 Tax=Dokdonella sp. TaxID=2291710 RepID=UPI002D807017|nr:M13 family metallopeptidase [Dokdonella sp.]HET9032030.1 M13 family metallopeptidase [Dokdonella sp.]
MKPRITSAFPRRAILSSFAAFGLLLSACGQKAAEPVAETAPVATVEAPAPAPKPVLGDFGFDATGMDRSVKPGDDFFDYVNGTWVKNTEIPADRSSYSSFTTLSEQAQKDTRKILEAAASDASAEGESRKIGDYYTAFMDEAGIEAKGIKPIQAELDAIAGLKDKKALSAAFGASLRADVDLLNATDRYTDRLFGVWISANLKKPEEYVPYFVQGGLGMPDRDFYLEDGRMADLRKQYEAHVAKVFDLAGIVDGKAKAAKILELETAIAKAHATALETDDVEKGANTWMQKDFSSKAPGIDWTEFFEAAGLAEQQEYIVWQPKAVSGIAALVGKRSLADWKDYLTFHVIERESPYLPKAFVDEHFAFNNKAISGTPEQRDRWKRAVDEVDAALGEAVGKIYVKDHFSAETKARANEMVANLITAFGKRIDEAEWMSPETKVRAKAKLAGMKVGMGYPDKWRDYSALEVRRDDALGNAERAELFEYQRNLAKLGQPIDRGEWFMLPQTVNALNIPLENRLTFPAAILQAPFFDGAADDAINYGGIGGVIGHEISHSFDNNGALFDETGKLENWWTKEDFARFEAAGAALAAQYDQYKPFPDLSVNGKLTLAENIADVAGLATAYDAYKLAHANEPAETLDGFTPDQRLFLGWGQVWRSKFREQALRNGLLTNGHAPGHYRAQTVRNIDAWYPAFNVEAGQALYLAPDARVKVW